MTVIEEGMLLYILKNTKNKHLDRKDNIKPRSFPHHSIKIRTVLVILLSHVSITKSVFRTKEHEIEHAI